MFDFNETIFGGSEKGWYDCKEITPDDYKRCCFETQAKMGDFGFVSNIIENHDEPRGVSHYIPEGRQGQRDIFVGCQSIQQIEVLKDKAQLFSAKVCSRCFSAALRYHQNPNIPEGHYDL